MKLAARFLVVASAGTLLTASGAPAISRRFNDDRVGAAPVGFSLASMRQATPGTWLVRRPAADGYLVHESNATATGYALAIADGPMGGNLQVSARLRLAGGARTGGVVWRYQDDQNFYAALLDLTHQELSVYRFAGGNRVRIELEGDLELDPEAWHSLKVRWLGRSIRVSLGGIRVFEDDDRRAEQATEAGRVGFIATGHSEVWFDDLHAEPHLATPERR